MARMVRKQVYIEPRQEKLLKQRAKELHVSEAELIRRGIDRVVKDAPTTESNKDARREAIKRLFEFIETHRKFDVPQTGRSWTREELYEERFERYSR